MVRELNAEERAQVEALGQKLFDWERLIEEHSAILRTDVNAYAEAHQQYVANAPPMGTLPPRDKYEEHISLGERVLEKECVTFLDHVEAATTLVYLCRLQMKLNSELGWPIQLAILEYVTAKHANHQYAPSHMAIPQNLHPLLQAELFGLGTGSHSPIQTSSESESLSRTDDYPAFLPGQPFSWNDIQDYPRTSILPTDLAFYKSNPESLSELTFTSSGEGDEAFRVSSFLTIGKDAEKIFYVVFADEGPDAFGYASSDFFTLLESAQRVITEGGK